MNFAFPPKLTSAHLKTIARLCGKSRSGTKAVIADRVVDDLKTFTPLAPGTRVLSIDLGIRNLAYSLLEVPNPNHGLPAKNAKGTKKKGTVPSSTTTIPRLLAWERLALIPKADKVVPPKRSTKKSRKRSEADGENDADQQDEQVLPKKSRRKAKTEEVGPGHQADDLAAEADSATTPVLMEDFSPARLSALAVDLILNRLLPLRPDVVTLEQQRFRQMGGSGVYEWTLRVNSLESMLYAVLTLLRETGQWHRGGRIEPVVARNVLEFMVVRDRAAGFDVGDIWGRGADNKKVKKDIIGRALASAGGLAVEDAAEAVASEYLDEWQGKKSHQRKADRMKKLDDLADCLLQGLAFIHWQDNKRLLVEGGVDALQDQMIE
ncbi:putative endodeoxyribonuclease-like protein [Diaporthe ampelina]|uniref:Putative endodeoxyribonuclease-like protein n=1 Tax=Diaporthe ampelina TaxID=1214573 RepID=A0A0G2HR80_9PEZI|nr:putative endodeoxyribonuclease-like protein [Diaporthe ampelina]